METPEAERTTANAVTNEKANVGNGGKGREMEEVMCDGSRNSNTFQFGWLGRWSASKNQRRRIYLKGELVYGFAPRGRDEKDSEYEERKILWISNNPGCIIKETGEAVYVGSETRESDESDEL